MFSAWYSIPSLLPGKFMYIADLLSRNFEEEVIPDDPTMADMVHVLSEYVAEISDEKFEKFQKETQADPVLSKLLDYYNTQWPSSVSEGGELSHFLKLKNEITVDQGIVYYNRRLVVPVVMRRYIISCVCMF